tara:strand:- start:434 stop:1591 length:1158 start_codon:yes stop_codon:yes gene_type:complete
MSVGSGVGAFVKGFVGQYGQPDTSLEGRMRERSEWETSEAGKKYARESVARKALDEKNLSEEIKANAIDEIMLNPKLQSDNAKEYLGDLKPYLKERSLSSVSAYQKFLNQDTFTLPTGVQDGVEFGAGKAGQMTKIFVGASGKNWWQHTTNGPENAVKSASANLSLQHSTALSELEPQNFDSERDRQNKAFEIAKTRINPRQLNIWENYNSGFTENITKLVNARETQNIFKTEEIFASQNRKVATFRAIASDKNATQSDDRNLTEAVRVLKILNSGSTETYTPQQWAQGTRYLFSPIMAETAMYGNSRLMYMTKQLNSEKVQLELHKIMAKLFPKTTANKVDTPVNDDDNTVTSDTQNNPLNKNTTQLNEELRRKYPLIYRGTSR